MKRVFLWCSDILSFLYVVIAKILGAKQDRIGHYLQGLSALRTDDI